MFKFNELKQIHLEISNNCQASCPMCSRNIHGGIDNPLIKVSNWTLEQYKNSINSEVLIQVESLYFCGNFGDPLLNNDLLDMIKYTNETNPNVSIRVHTNGSLRNTQWWQELARSMPTNHIVIFALDGLEDTHSLYRIGTDFNQILKNAKAFIDAGGNAEWAFIRFKHNQHQVEDARKLAIDLGFKNFVMKDSSRFLVDNKFPVLDKNGSTVYNLEPSTESKIVFIQKKDIENYKKIVENSSIDCFAQTNKEVYLDSNGYLFPCCWIASTPYNYIDDNTDAAVVRHEIARQYELLINDLGGIDKLDITKHSIKDIINSTEYQTVWGKYWNEEKLITCVRSCGVNNLSKPVDQFTIREQVNE
jgi:MoaA/NifB/PqqE/SkfB family radical SAM enzyme